MIVLFRKTILSACLYKLNEVFLFFDHGSGMGGLSGIGSAFHFECPWKDAERKDIRIPRIVAVDLQRHRVIGREAQFP